MLTKAAAIAAKRSGQALTEWAPETLLEHAFDVQPERPAGWVSVGDTMAHRAGNTSDSEPSRIAGAGAMPQSGVLSREGTPVDSGGRLGLERLRLSCVY